MKIRLLSAIVALMAASTAPLFAATYTWDGGSLLDSNITTANTGNAADLFDFDKDGIVNLVEFAFGLTPTVPDAHLMPQAQRVGNDLVYSFTPPPGVSGIAYGAETSETMAPGDWDPVPNTGTAPVFEFQIPLGAKPKGFLRLTVTGLAESLAE